MNAKNGSTPFNTECYLFHLLLTTLGLPKATSLSTPAIPWEDCALAAVFFPEAGSRSGVSIHACPAPLRLSCVLWHTSRQRRHLQVPLLWPRFSCHASWALFCGQVALVRCHFLFATCSGCCFVIKFPRCGIAFLATRAECRLVVKVHWFGVTFLATHSVLFW